MINRPPHLRRWAAPNRRLATLCLAIAAGTGAGVTLASAADGPAIDAGKIRAITEDVLRSQRDPRGQTEKVEALRAYERFIMEDFATRSALKAEALHRLGDLYTEIETSAFEKRVHEARARPGVRGRTPTPPTVDRTKSMAVYERLLALYPDRSENDGALYQLARAYWEIGRVDDGMARLEELRKRFPRSRYAAEAAFRLGEQAVTTRDFLRAAELFQQALSGRLGHPAGSADAVLAETVAFHLGWTYLNLGEYLRAIETLVLILDAKTPRTAGDGGETPPSGTASRPETDFSLADFSDVDAAFLRGTINAVLIAFDYLGGPSEMRAYFGKAGPRRYEEILYRTMATLYDAQARTAEAVEAYETFVAAHPSHRHAPAFQSAIAETYTKAQWQEPLIEARSRLVKRYGPDSAWARANDEPARVAARRLVKEALYQLALYDHARAQTAKRPAGYEQAVRRDDQFLALFPTEVESPRVAWLRADALFELGRYREAAEAYTQTAYDYPLHMQTREAGYAAVVAWERVLPEVIDAESADGLLARIDRFLNAFPDDPRNPDLLMKAAESAARAGLAQRGLDAAQRLVTAYPTSRWIVPAKRLIGQTLYDRRDYPGAERVFREALAAAAGPAAETIAALAAAALYQEANARRAEGNAEAAAQAYVRVADEFPATPLAPAALLDAAAVHADRGETAAAVRLWSRIALQHADQSQAAEALRRLGAAAATAGDAAGAIGWYERLTARSTDAAEGTALLWTIGRLAEQAQLWPSAERAFSELTWRTALPADQAIEAGFRAGQALARQGRADEAQRTSEELLARYQAWRGREAAGMPHSPGAELLPVDLLAAAATLDLGDRRAAAFSAIRLAEPLDRALIEKQTALNRALDTYTEAVAFKVAEVTTAATHKIGTLFEAFLRDLLESERPGELTAEQLEQYQILLEERAAPYEDRAVNAYETNLRRTHELGLYDEWVRRSVERLAVLQPARYQRHELAELLRRDLVTR